MCGPVLRGTEAPPGVDIELGRPEEREVALAALLDEARKDAPNLGNAEERLPDDGNAARLAPFLAGELPTVVYFGKLIEQKGVHVLLDALKGLDARVVVVGFGPERASLETHAASEGVRALFTGPRSSTGTCGTCSPSPTRVSCPPSSPRRSGGAAKAAAAGCPPVVSRHSGLAEVAAELEAALPPALGPLVSFPTGDARARKSRLARCSPCPRRTEALRSTVRRVVEERWSWAGIARRLLELAT